MKRYLSSLVLSLFVFISLSAIHANADDSAKLEGLFAAGGNVLIPPGDYQLDGTKPIEVRSGSTIQAYGARFDFPKKVGDRARLVMFSGTDVTDIRWFGGHFTGSVFDPAKDENSWEPNSNARAIFINTTPGGRTENLTFRDLSSNGLAGAVITVLGAEKKGNDREIDIYARNVTVENSTLERSGRFMWDYGYLWQVTVWPEEHSARERAIAAKYFRNDLIRGPVRMAEADDRVYLAIEKPIPLSILREGDDAKRGRDSICFFGDKLPSNLIRGREYFVVESNREFLRIATKPGGTPIKFETSAGPETKLIVNLYDAYFGLFSPIGSGPGKGAIDLVGCENVVVRGCRMSALGDAMHIQKSRVISFANNHITGARMGAFFLAEFCKNATVIGNTIDGTNGSRVMSVEKSCEDVTIVANTFRNGGRGSWINQPKNFILSDNIFINNTTKCEQNPSRGRKTFQSGGYESYSELYFTTHEPNGRYSNVLVRGNLFSLGPEVKHAISFEPGGSMIRVTQNTFANEWGNIVGTENCNDADTRGNYQGVVLKQRPKVPEIKP